MLAIRMQRTGRSGRAMFRVVVQEARRTPTSGKIVALLGNYDPRTKALALDKDQASFYLKNGARPSERTARLLRAEGVALPAWVSISEKKQGKLRNPEKLRRNQPKKAPVEAAATEAETKAETEPAEEVTAPTAEAEQ